MINWRSIYFFEFRFLFAANNYDALIATLDRIPKVIPKSKSYIKLLDEDIEAQKQAIISGDTEKMAETVRQGAEDTKDGAHTVKPNGKLYQLGSKTAPTALDALADGFEDGTKTAADENALMGKFNVIVQDALDHPK